MEMTNLLTLSVVFRNKTITTAFATLVVCVFLLILLLILQLRQGTYPEHFHPRLEVRYFVHMCLHNTKRLPSFKRRGTPPYREHKVFLLFCH